MNDPEYPFQARFAWIRPRWFLRGFLAGLVSLAFTGWRISRTDYHPGFVRFHTIISPECNYYPTLDEMCSIVRSICRPDQILVIVGGNSILLGVWQRENDVWSKRLQELLGSRYCVVNFAFRGGSPTDGGAVVAEALRLEFPKQILIVNEAPVTAIEPLGHDPYRYIFWQGYYEGKLTDSSRRSAQISELLQRYPLERRRFLETQISVWFDSLFHFRDLWNWIDFEYVGTVPSYQAEYFPRFLKPRRAYPDPEIDGTDHKYDDAHYRPSGFEAEMRIIRGPSVYYSLGSDGHWLLAAPTRFDMSTHFKEAFPTPLKGRTLVLISGSSPFYCKLLTPNERAMLRQAYLDTVEIWQEAGYPAMEYGLDFTSQDFGDRTHLTKFGGWKLATQVAPEVSSLSKRLGYMQ